MAAFLCATCGTQYPPSDEPPPACPICLDERQYVGHGGQRWTTLDELREKHRLHVEEDEPGLVGVGLDPPFAIGQRALKVEQLLWDCLPLAQRVYGAWWDTVVADDAKAKVLRSADRYVDAVTNGRR